MTNSTNNAKENSNSPALKALAEFISKASAWDRAPTKTAGLFFVNRPAGKRNQFGKQVDVKASLGVELNPVGEDGKPMKRTGMYVSSLDELQAWRALLSSPKIEDAIRLAAIHNGTEAKEVAPKNTIAF